MKKILKTNTYNSKKGDNTVTSSKIYSSKKIDYEKNNIIGNIILLVHFYLM